MQVSPNQKIASQIFLRTCGIYAQFLIFWKKGWASEVISFLIYRLQKVGLLNILKNPMSEHLWTVNMLKGP